MQELVFCQKTIQLRRVSQLFAGVESSEGQFVADQGVLNFFGVTVPTHFLNGRQTWTTLTLIGQNFDSIADRETF